MNDSAALNKLEVFLKDNHADYKIYNDDLSVATAKIGAERYGISLDETTPTLILKSKDKYYAVIICGSTRISFKKLKQALNIKDVSLADPETVLQLTGAKIGEVCMINTLETLIDEKVLSNKDCYGGCGIPNTTLKINTQDLIRLTKATVLNFTDPRV